jgi:hypothetical protein
MVMFPLIMVLSLRQHFIFLLFRNKTNIICMARQKKQLPKSVIDNEFNFINSPISSLNLIALKKQDVIFK